MCVFSGGWQQSLERRGEEGEGGRRGGGGGGGRGGGGGGGGGALSFSLSLSLIHKLYTNIVGGGGRRERERAHSEKSVCQEGVAEKRPKVGRSVEGGRRGATNVGVGNDPSILKWMD